MEEKSKGIKVMVDGYTRFMLTIIAILLTVLAVGMWCETPQLSSSAAAGRLPDSGLQFDQIRDSVDQVNQSIQQLSSLMVSGQVRVRLMDSTGAPVSAKAITSPNETAK